MDTGTIVIIVAVLFFYLRLILIQRERAKRAKAAPPAPRGKKKGKIGQPPSFAERYSILSRRKVDWVIAGAGVVLILAGVLLSVRLLPVPTAQAYWWLLVALGIVAFSFGFR